MSLEDLLLSWYPSHLSPSRNSNSELLSTKTSNHPKFRADCRSNSPLTPSVCNRQRVWTRRHLPCVTPSLVPIYWRDRYLLHCEHDLTKHHFDKNYQYSKYLQTAKSLGHNMHGLDDPHLRVGGESGTLSRGTPQPHTGPTTRWATDVSSKVNLP